MNDDNMDKKLQTMIGLINQEKNAMFQELQEDYKSKVSDYENRINEEIKNLREQELEKANKKAQNIINIAKTKAEFILKKERLKSKNAFISNFFEALKEALSDLNEKDKTYLYRKLYREAKEMIGDNFVVFCNPKDKKIVKTIVKDAKIETDEKIQGGILLKSGDLRIYNTLDSFIQENKSKILDLLAKEVGEL